MRVKLAEDHQIGISSNALYVLSLGGSVIHLIRQGLWLKVVIII